MGNVMYHYIFDVYKNELISDCKFYPTEVNESDTPWLWAGSNKYPNRCLESNKIGKWMLFSPKDRVNAIWDKVKMAVKNGEIAGSKVSTVNSQPTHAIIIYTKDHTDLADIIRVHDYLESSGIKSPNETLYYKTDKQTSAGVFSGGNERPWIYSSHTIRKPVYNYEFDLHENELISDCKLNPSEVNESNAPWLIARNNKYPYWSIDYEKVGKWMLFLSKDRVDAAWDKIKMAVKNGELHNSKVSTDNSQPSHAIMVYTKDYTDLDDVIRVHNFLESSGIKSPDEIIYYKTYHQTYGGVYSGGRQRPWIYSSYTIRDPATTPPTNLEK